MDKTPRRKIYSLYQYTNPSNGKRYIGLTCDIKHRQWNHKNRSSGTRAFHNAIKKYGYDHFEFKVLAIFDDANAAAYHEQAAIRSFNTMVPNGYNLLGGAATTKYQGTLSTDHRERVRQGLLRYHATHEPITISPEQQEKLFLGRQKKGCSLETRAKMSAARLGKHFSASHRAALSQALKRYWHNPNHVPVEHLAISMQHLEPYIHRKKVICNN